MKQIAPVLIVAIVVGGAALGIYSLLRGQPTETPPQLDSAVVVRPDITAGTDTGSPLPEEASGPTAAAGRYVPFTPEVLANSANTRRVLYFYANWCPTCRPADADFIQNTAQIPADVTVIRVNYNDSDTDQAEKDLARQYDITYQHTFVQIDGQGNVVTQWNGGAIDELLQNLK